MGCNASAHSHPVPFDERPNLKHIPDFSFLEEDIKKALRLEKINIIPLWMEKKVNLLLTKINQPKLHLFVIFFLFPVNVHFSE